jgi:arylsulfatase A-like enzyme
MAQHPGPTPPTGPARPRRPRNVLFIWTDQQRPDTIGAYSNRGAASGPQTPNLDRLAAQGALFEQAYCAQPVCSPSRASVLTGTYPHTHGVVQNGLLLPRTLPTLAELLRPHGYACGYVGKWHLGRERTPQRGFEDWWASTESYAGGYAAGSPEARSATSYYRFLVERGYAAAGGYKLDRTAAARLPEVVGKPAFQAAECVRFLETFRDRPFLLMCNFLEPHPPYNGPFDGLYDPATVPLPDSWYRDFDPTVPRRHRGLRREMARDPRGRLGGNSERGWKALTARYWGSCTLVDKYAGVILDRLDALGLADDTVVVYSTDHGDMMGEHGLLGKSVPYEGATRVPLIVRAPQLPDSAGRRLATPVSQVSLVPALLELLDLPAPAYVQGESLVPLLRSGDTAPNDAEVAFEWNGGLGESLNTVDGVPRRRPEGLEAGTAIPSPDDSRTIRRGRWKLTVHATGETELYDLVADPGEAHNAADPRYERTVRDLHERLLAWQRRTGDARMLPVPAPIGAAAR